MPGSFPSRLLALATVVVALTLPALAQSDEDDRDNGYNAIIDNIDVLVEHYTRILARKYDLTEEQHEYTKSLMHERTYEFLERYETEARQITDRWFEVRTGGEMTAEELIEWGQRFKPLWEEAKNVITKGNDEWREILTDEQKQLHDEDLRLMNRNFETFDEQLEQIVSGQMTVEEFRSPQRSRRRPSQSQRTEPPMSPKTSEAPPSSPAGEEPPVVYETPRDQLPEQRPAQLGPAESKPPAPVKARKDESPELAPAERKPPVAAARPSPRRREPAAPAPHQPGRAQPHGRSAPGKAAATGFESQWEQYVREFIAKYRLNDEQTQKANAVLDDCQAQANRYLLGRKEQIEKIDQQLEELKQSKDKNRAKTLSELTKKRSDLMEPIDRIYEQQLKPRLERLPTRAQRRAAAQTPAKKESAAHRAPPKKPPVKQTPVEKKPEKPSGDEKD